MVFDKKMIILLKSKSGNVPYGAILDVSPDFTFENLEVVPGDAVKFEKKLLVLRDVGIDFGSAKIWNGILKLDLPLNSLSKMERNVRSLVDILKKSGNLEGLAGLVCGFNNEYTKNFRLNQFLKSLEIGDSQKLCELFGNMVGLGPGLTPSSDDFFAGFLSTFLYLTDQNYSKMFRCFEQHLNRTTPISAIMLKASLEREAPEIVKNVILDVCNREISETNIKKMIDLGATSGSDMAAGISYGVRSWIDLEMKKGG